MIEKRNIIENNASPNDKLAEVVDAGVDQFMKKSGDKQAKPDIKTDTNNSKEKNTEAYKSN